MVFNEAQHPRASRGTSTGGQFTNVVKSEQAGSLTLANDGETVDARRHVTRSECLDNDVKAVLGEHYADFDIDAIGDDVIRYLPDESRYVCDASHDDFWAIAARHDVATAAIEKVNAYGGDNIWQDVILRLNGYDEDATSDVDPNHKSDAFVVARRVIRHDQARGEWFSAETIDEYRDTDTDDDQDEHRSPS